MSDDGKDPFSHFDMHIAKGDFVTLSTETGYFGLNHGVVCDVRPDFIEIQLDDEIRVRPPMRGVSIRCAGSQMT